LGEKQAMEDRLRKLVLQSQKARGRGKVEAMTTAPATLSPPPQQQQNGVQQTLGSSATVSISSHSFSLEDMAVSFITQTIDTIKSQPAPSPVVSSAVVGTAKPSPSTSNSNSNVRLELAAKQKRLEDHISESKALMAKLSQARSKEEKDVIMKVIREKSRLFEGSHTAPTMPSSASTTESKPQTPVPPHHLQNVRWPDSHENGGVLILSDDSDDD